MGSSSPIPIICGPTGSGKTAVAVALADRFPVEIVSADSRQIIRHLNIGTAKPEFAAREKIPVHLVDIIDPGERYTAYRFIDDAVRAIDDILSRGRIPLVVGGTGLYLQALTEGVAKIEEDNTEIRDRIEQEMAQLGPEVMHQRLAKIDPSTAAAVHPNNRVRVIRALEVFYLTGKTKSELVAVGSYRKTDYVFEYYCLMPEREKLYQDINERVDLMVADGLLEELQRLVADGWADKIRKANVIGYQEMLRHIDGRIELEDAINLIKQNSRRYAKRQMTWFRHQVGCNEFSDSKSLQGALISALENWNSESKNLDSPAR